MPAPAGGRMHDQLAGLAAQMGVAGQGAVVARCQQMLAAAVADLQHDVLGQRIDAVGLLGRGGQGQDVLDLRRGQPVHRADRLCHRHATKGQTGSETGSWSGSWRPFGGTTNL